MSPAARCSACSSSASPRPMLCASAKTTSGAFCHSCGKRLSASEPTRRPGDDVDDGLQHDAGAAGALERAEAGLDGVAAGLLADLGLDDHGRGPGQHVHQALVAVGEALVGGQAGGAEGAVQGAVAEGHGDGDVGADAGELRRRAPHRVGVLAQVRHDRRQVAVEHALAQGELLLLLVALLEHPRHGGVDDLQGLRRPVHAGEEGDAQVQRLLRGAQEVGDLLPPPRCDSWPRRPIGAGRRPPDPAARRLGRTGVASVAGMRSEEIDVRTGDRLVTDLTAQAARFCAGGGRRAAVGVRAARHGRRGAHGDRRGQRDGPGHGAGRDAARRTTAGSTATARRATAATTSCRRSCRPRSSCPSWTGG